MNKILLFVTAIFLIIACNKEEPIEENPVEELSYYPQEVGNYWVYDHYWMDKDGTETFKENLRDSIVITHDTLINSNIYYVYEGTDCKMGIREPEVLKILRDSAGYLVNTEGDISFSSVNFEDELLFINYILPDGDTMYTTSYRMNNQPITLKTPAGTFKALNFQGTLYDRDHSNPRYLNNYHARGVGEVLNDYFYLSDSTRHNERRLVKYHVN